VFDGYADCFDAHLASLGYRVPGLMRALLLEHLPALRRRQPVGPALDLGCGTGTIGVVLSDLPVRPLVGIDLSSKMLNEARAKRVYAELRQDDIETALATYAAEEQSWALIISADALCYFGELEAVIRGAFAALQPGGLFVFSVEELPAPRSVPPSHGANENGTTGHGGHENGANDGANDGASRDATRDAATDKAWRLGPLGRYAHRADTLRALAVSAGFDILALRREVVRHDCGTMVHGLLVLLARPE
jgi:predicted TPR repeat methyltransferase